MLLTLYKPSLLYQELDCKKIHRIAAVMLKVTQVVTIDLKKGLTGSNSGVVPLPHLAKNSVTIA